MSLETLFEQLQEGDVQDLNLVLKGDVVGSVEAAVSELAKIEHPEVRVNVIHQGVGGITENDIMLASASNALVVGFNVRPNAEARELADREGVEIRTYRVIYQLTEDIEQALVGMLSAVKTEETIGEAEVRALFRVSRLGHDRRLHGHDRRRAPERAGARHPRRHRDLRRRRSPSCRRFKDDVREVAEGFECGILLDGFNDVKEGDVLEVFETREVERTGLDEPALAPVRVADRSGPEVPRGSARSPAAPHASASVRHRAVTTGPATLECRMAAGFVGILTVELHFPESALAEGEAHVPALREGAARRTASARRSPRSTTTTSGSAHGSRSPASRGEAREAERLLDEAERWLRGQEWELASADGFWSIPRTRDAHRPRTDLAVTRRRLPPQAQHPEAAQEIRGDDVRPGVIDAPDRDAARPRAEQPRPGRRRAGAGSAPGSAAASASQTSAATTPCPYQEKNAVEPATFASWTLSPRSRPLHALECPPALRPAASTLARQPERRRAVRGADGVETSCRVGCRRRSRASRRAGRSRPSQAEWALHRVASMRPAEVPRTLRRRDVEDHRAEVPVREVGPRAGGVRDHRVDEVAARAAFADADARDGSPAPARRPRRPPAPATRGSDDVEDAEVRPASACGRRGESE